MDLAPFAELAAAPDPPLDALALALAAEFRDVDAGAAATTLDALGRDLAKAVAGTHDPEEQARACADTLGGTHGFAGDGEQYDAPRNSMLDVVLERRRGLPIVLSVVYVEAARRAGLPLAGVGLPGHFVVGHFGADPPLLLDPFNGGVRIEAAVPATLVRPWTAKETAMRMLNNLVPAFQRRGDVAAAIRAARLRLALPAGDGERSALRDEVRMLEARLN